MKYSIECPVVSNILLKRPMLFVKGEKEYFFFTNAGGFLISIKIVKKVDNPEAFFSEIYDSRPTVINIKQDLEVYQEIMSDLQYLEGHIGLVASLQKIHWNEPKIEWIPETEEEKYKLKVFSSHFYREKVSQPTELSKILLEEIINDKPILKDLTVLMSFYREGKVFFDRLEFTNAFYDFYFILEDIYGEGSWRNQQIESKFKSSTQLQNIIKWALSKLDEIKTKDIMELLQQKNLKYCVEDIIALLVQMRGHLHHFSSKSKINQKPSPLIQQNYETLAFLTMAIAVQSILSERNKLKKREK